MPVVSIAARKNVQPVVLTYSDIILADNPLHYWRFGETSGTVSNDEMNTNNGTYSSITLGRNGIVSGPDTAISNVNGVITMTKLAYSGIDHSIEIWFNANTLSGWSTLFAEATTLIGLYLNGITPTLWFNGQAFSSNTTVTTDVTYHIVLTIAGTTATFYLNGVADGTVANATVPLQTDRIGNDNSSENFDGILDEAAVYDYALTAEQVLNHYNAGKLKYHETVLADNPLHYWRFNEVSGTVVNDEMGLINGIYDRTPTLGVPSLINDTTTTAVNMVSGEAILDTSITLSGTEFSTETWFKYTTVPNPADFQTLIDGGVAGSSGIYIDPATFKINYFFDSASHLANTVIQLNVIYHLVITVSAAGGTLFYLNSNNDGIAVQAPPQDFKFIGGNDRADNNDYLGILDEMAIYDYALTPEQVIIHYNDGI